MQFTVQMNESELKDFLDFKADRNSADKELNETKRKLAELACVVQAVLIDGKKEYTEKAVELTQAVFPIKYRDYIRGGWVVIEKKPSALETPKA